VLWCHFDLQEFSPVILGSAGRGEAKACQRRICVLLPRTPPRHDAIMKEYVAEIESRRTARHREQMGVHPVVVGRNVS
jgi:hypothetical protein